MSGRPIFSESYILLFSTYVTHMEKLSGTLLYLYTVCVSVCICPEYRVSMRTPGAGVSWELSNLGGYGNSARSVGTL